MTNTRRKFFRALAGGIAATALLVYSKAVALAASPSTISNSEAGSTVRADLNKVINTTNALAVNVKDYGATGNGSTDDTVAIQNAINAAFPGTGNFNNRPLFFPAGQYIISNTLYLLGQTGSGVVGAHIYGAGNGITQIFYQDDGHLGNTLSTEFPNLAPVFAIDGFGYSVIENISLAVDHTRASAPVDLVTNATTAVGNATLHFASVPATITIGMQAYDRTVTSAGGPIVGYVVSKTATTVVMSSNVAGLVGVGNGDTITFVNPVCGVLITQTTTRGTTTALQFRNMNFAEFGIGLIAGDSGSANCENCTMYDCQMNLCALYGIRLLGQNTLNWQLCTFGASQCGTVSTFVTNQFAGNCSAAVSVTTGGITAISNMSISGTSGSVDIYHNGSQTMNIVGGRSESLNSIIVADGHMNMIGWQWGPTATSCRIFDLSLSGTAVVENCVLSPSLSGGGTKLVAALGNDGHIQFNNTAFDVNASQMSITGAASSEVSITGFWRGSSLPTMANLFASFTGTVLECSALHNTTVAALPTANAKFTGLRASVTDATSSTYNATVANSGGGTGKFQVQCNATNWVHC